MTFVSMNAAKSQQSVKVLANAEHLEKAVYLQGRWLLKSPTSSRICRE